MVETLVNVLQGGFGIYRHLPFYGLANGQGMAVLLARREYHAKTKNEIKGCFPHRIILLQRNKKNRYPSLRPSCGLSFQL